MWGRNASAPTFASGPATNPAVSSSSAGAHLSAPSGRSTPLGAILRGGSLLKHGAGEGTNELDWSLFGETAREALHKWSSGRLGGRHCMLVVQQGGDLTCNDSASSSATPSMADLRSGAALNVLSGLHVSGVTAGGVEDSWLFKHVFSKTPEQVLEEGLAAVVAEIGSGKIHSSRDLTPEQAHLALRRLTMKAQNVVLQQFAASLSNSASSSSSSTSNNDDKNAEDAKAKGSEKSPESTAPARQAVDEFVRVQVWMELLRLHLDLGGHQQAPSASGGGPPNPSARERRPPPLGGAGGGSASAPSTNQGTSGASNGAGGLWQDATVLAELGKDEDAIQNESNSMSLEVLRHQNRAIEDYVMNLVRIRDEIRHVTKLAEERDAYYILGLEGPACSDTEIKKAYRNLSRKEHPDKAGIGNTRKFQAIQQAYTNVMRQRQEGFSSGHDVGTGGESSDSPAASPDSEAPCVAVQEALHFAHEAMRAAELAAGCAHRAMLCGEGSKDVAGGATRKGFRTLREYTGQGIRELQDASLQLRALGHSLDAAVKCMETALSPDSLLQRSFASRGGPSVLEMGLRDRAALLEDAGRGCQSSAELMEKIAEATEATLGKVDVADTSAGPNRRGAAGGDANLVRLGSRLLGESLVRIAGVSRRSADEALGSAMRALDLARGLLSLEQEAKKERQRARAHRDEGTDEGPVVAPDVERSGGAKNDEQTQQPPPESSDSMHEEGTDPSSEKASREDTEVAAGDQLKSAAKRVKERHVALRVKNLVFLNSLNEETMRAQTRLRELLDRSEGALLPLISVPQKKQIFELVSQLVEAALADCQRGLAAPNAKCHRVLEKCFNFILALEHCRNVAMPSDSRTQALKLAAMVDLELLCQLLGGPFRLRLLNLNTSAQGRGRVGGPSNQGQGTGIRARSTGPPLPGQCQSAPSNSKAWEESVNACCKKMVEVVRAAMLPPPPPTPEE